jgi:hypothetical protein
LDLVDIQTSVSDTSGIEAPTIEWTYHKSSDGTHPDSSEQQAMWLMNRARSDPTQEGIWLATTPDGDIAFPRDYFNVDKVKLQAEFATYAAMPPAAFDVRLYNAAKAHSDDLIVRDAQDHNGQYDRVGAAGFSLWDYRGNVFAYSENAMHLHGAWNIDYASNDPDGMQDSRGHRKAVMSIDGDYTNVGIAMVPDNDTTNDIGPVVSTGNYCQANEGVADHYNQFLVGTVWQDLDGDSMYDPGEGIGGVTVTPEQGTYFAITANSGGYAIPLTATGTYNVAFTGNGVNQVKSVTVADVSVLLDITSGGASGPTVTSIEPSSGANTGAISITNLAGSNFSTSGATTVELRKSGQSSITATDVTVVNQSKITCSFDLTGAATGSWDVVVTNPDSLSGTLSGGFTVTSGGTPPDEFIYLPLVMGGHTSIPTYYITGSIRDGSNAPLAGVTVSDGAGHTTTTDANGDYSLGGLPAGMYTLTPTMSGYTFSPTSITVSVPPDAAGHSFVGTPASTPNQRLVVFEAFFRST